MDGLNLIPLFLTGVAGSVHCIGMCGGIVSAFAAAPARPAFPLAVVTLQPALASNALTATARTLSYNGGRIASYMGAGALAGGAGGGVATLAALAPWQGAAYWLANLLLIAIGLYLMNAWRGLAWLELAGQGLWRRVRPLTARMLPADTPARMLALGALWGWLPCGMVYSVLVVAMLSGSAVQGALVMAAFGLGTLPMLLMLGLAGSGLRQRLQTRALRRAAGVLVAGFGLLGVVRALGGDQGGWASVLCLTGPLA